MHQTVGSGYLGWEEWGSQIGKLKHIFKANIHSYLDYDFPPNKFWVFLINLFILFLAASGLHCCAQAFSSCGKWGPLFVAVRGLLIVVGGSSCCGARALGTRASVVAACWLSSCGLRALEHRLSSCGAQA